MTGMVEVGHHRHHRRQCCLYPEWRPSLDAGTGYSPGLLLFCGDTRR